MEIFKTLLRKAGLLDRAPLVCSCGKIMPAVVDDALPGENCYICGVYRCIHCLVQHPSRYHSYKGFELHDDGRCPGACTRKYERTEVLPWKEWVDAEIAREALENAAAKVRLVESNGKGKPTLNKTLTSHQYDSWEEAKSDLKLQAAELGCRVIWCVKHHPVSYQNGNYIFNKWIFTGTV